MIQLPDKRSDFVGNVDSATTDELEQHFRDCGSVTQVTIPCNKSDGLPRGFEYVEYDNNSAKKREGHGDGRQSPQGKADQR